MQYKQIVCLIDLTNAIKYSTISPIMTFTTTSTKGGLVHNHIYIYIFISHFASQIHIMIIFCHHQYHSFIFFIFYYYPMKYHKRTQYIGENNIKCSFELIISNSVRLLIRAKPIK